MRTLLFAVVLSLFPCVTPAADNAKPVAETPVLRATVTGAAGDTVTCFTTNRTATYAVVFRGEVPRRMVAEVAWRTPDGNERVERQESSDGQLPIFNGKVCRLTLDFREAGSCSIEVVESRQH